ncbi:MAG: 4Fe-4S binding protein [Promethearchaeota archaeon]|jgi:Pyruvate/2-oxoacid:ferredoxin oxidoreductase delta subunit
MTEVDYYEIVRQKLQFRRITAPKHKKVYKLMKIFWDEDEIKILSQFNNVGLKISRKELAEKTGISEEEIEELLRRSARNGTILRTGSDYRLLPLVPGIFEMYFIRRKDSQENLHKVAEIYRYIFKNRTPDLEEVDNIRRGFRPLLPYDFEEKLIKVDESLDVESQVLPFEVVKDMIDKNESFAVVPCQCRLIGEYTGESCELAPAEMGCFLTGEAAERQIAYGARRLTKEEAIEFIRETEKAGLVHNTIADTSKDTSKWICNCCSCHCGSLLPAKLYHYKGVNQTNFAPEFDMELCTKCEICIEKCPNEAVYHIWPNKSDSSDERMKVREEICIGCGTCAVNCPNNSIKMVKERDEYPKGISIDLFS